MTNPHDVTSPTEEEMELDFARARTAKLRLELDFADAQAKAARAEVSRLMDGMELAWGVIANAQGGDWDAARPEWKQAAERWRDEHWHPSLKRNLPALSQTKGGDERDRAVKWDYEPAWKSAVVRADALAAQLEEARVALRWIADSSNEWHRKMRDGGGDKCRCIPCYAASVLPAGGGG